MSTCGVRISGLLAGVLFFPCDREEKSSPQLQEDSEAGLLNRECLGVTPFDDHATPCWAPFMGVIGSLNRMLLCGNAAAPHCVGFPTWQDGSALCWVPNTMPNAGGVATNQASADKCAAVPTKHACSMIPSSYRGSLQVSLRPAPLHLEHPLFKAGFMVLHVETDVSPWCSGFVTRDSFSRILLPSWPHLIKESN